MKPDHSQHGAKTPPAEKHTPPSEDDPAPRPDAGEMKMPDGTSMKMSEHKGMKMPDDAAASGMTMDHGATVWPHFANMILGAWLITNVFALGYRSIALQVSDAVSGALVILLAILSVSATGAVKF